jgi:regulator of cell morphogenesis and NO signaling
MESEHEAAGTILKQIAKLSNNYTPPEWACNTFKALYAKLDEFEQDLHLHIHLENNILFPKALALEKELATKK